MADPSALPPSVLQALLEGPALQPPPGVTPNFTNPPNRNALAYAVIITALCISSFVAFSMLYIRIVYFKTLRFEHYLTILALGVFGGYIYASWASVLCLGFFVHQWDVRLKDVPRYFYLMNVGETIYGNLIMLLKVGILSQWSHVFIPGGHRNAFWWICNLTAATNIVFYVICTFVEIFACSPRKKFWSPLTPGHCPINTNKVIIASAFVNFFSDLIILFLPQAVIWRLNLSLRRKIGIAALFAVGIFATTCAGIRIKYSYEFADSPDKTYYVSPLGLWNFAEMTAGFLVLCLPSLPKLFNDSPWIKSIISTLKSMTRTTSKTSDNLSSKAQRTWPRSRQRRDPDASLFTNTDEYSFVRLTNIKGGSTFDEERAETSSDRDGTQFAASDRMEEAKPVVVLK